MRIFDLDKWTETLETLARNKSRSFLTAFGIFWAIFMLVLLLGGGQGLKDLMESNFEGVAQNSCEMETGLTTKAYKGLQSGREWHLYASDAEMLKRKIAGIAYCQPMLYNSGKNTRYKDRSSATDNRGVFPDMQKINNVKLRYGRFINETDCRLQRKVCVLSQKAFNDLFPKGENPCGESVIVDSIYYTIVGVEKSEDEAETNYLPFTTFRAIYNRGEFCDYVVFTTKPGISVASVQDQAAALIKERHLVAPDDVNALFVFNIEQMFQIINNFLRGINILIWIIGIGTLISGSIGVSNIMMVTVRERTTEIGIRRAIGARPSSIIKQIMAESIVLTILAGLSGVFFAVLILQLADIVVPMAANVETHFQISFSMAFGSAVALTILGGLAGIAPSLRALAIKPVDAMRDE